MFLNLIRLIANIILVKRGSKTVSVKGADSTSRCNIMIGASLRGEKVQPHTVLQGVNVGCTSQEFKQQHKEDYPSNVVLAVQENAWFADDIMLDLIESCWKKHVAKYDNQIYYLHFWTHLVFI
jgi:hypothetical protein